MLKSLVLLPIIFSLNFASAELTEQPVYAQNETTEVESEVVEESEITEEGFIDQTKAFLSKYLDEQLVMSIINWAIDAGLLSALFAVYCKYRKYKAKSSTEIAKEVKETVDRAVKETVDKLTKEQLEGIYKVVNNIEISLETTNKALVLAQDKTAEGKIALLNLISSKSNDIEVKDTAEEVKTKIIEEEATKEEVNKDVSGEYHSIF